MGGCPSKPDGRLLAEFEYYDPRQCATVCQEDYAGHCQTIVYDKKSRNEMLGTCSLWSMTGVEYQEACASHFGDYKVEECIDYSQYKYMNGICSVSTFQ